MRRCVKGLFVSIGWVIVYTIALVVVTPIVLVLEDPQMYTLTLEYALPMLIMTWSICVPIMYGAVFLITPLVMATIEVFSGEH